MDEKLHKKLEMAISLLQEVVEACSGEEKITSIEDLEKASEKKDKAKKEDEE